MIPSLWAKVMKAVQQRVPCHFHRGDNVWRIGPEPEWSNYRASPYQEYARRLAKAEERHNSTINQTRKILSQQHALLDLPSDHILLVGSGTICENETKQASKHILSAETDFSSLTRCMVRGTFVCSTIHDFGLCNQRIHISLSALSLLANGYIEHVGSYISGNKLRIDSVMISRDDVRDWVRKCLQVVMPRFVSTPAADSDSRVGTWMHYAFDPGSSHILHLFFAANFRSQQSRLCLVSISFVRRAYTKGVAPDDARLVSTWTTKRRK